MRYAKKHMGTRVRPARLSTWGFVGDKQRPTENGYVGVAATEGMLVAEAAGYRTDARTAIIDLGERYGPRYMLAGWRDVAPA